MDIVQARKKAREKAEQEAQARRHDQRDQHDQHEGVVRVPSPADQSPAIKKSSPARVAQQKPKTKPKAKTSAKTSGARADSKTSSVRADSNTSAARTDSKSFGARADSKTFGARVTPLAHPPDKPPASPTSEDVFLDMSFGEDLPVETMDAADFDLGPVGPKPSAKPPAPAPAQPATSQTLGAKPPSETLRAQADSKTLGAQARPAPSGMTSPAAPDLALERLSTEKEDFLELVSEDLYRREFGEEAQVEVGEQLELISFRLAQETYAIRLTHVQQIIKLREITLVPRAPAYILGVISLRGMIIPIFDLRSRLGLNSREATRQTRIIVVMDGPKIIGLIVDQVEQVVRIPSGAIEPPPPILGGLESEYIEGIGRFSGRMLILLNLGKVLAPPIPRDAGH